MGRIMATDAERNEHKSENVTSKIAYHTRIPKKKDPPATKKKNSVDDSDCDEGFIKE